MRDRLDDFTGPDGERAEVALVTFTTADELDAYQIRHRFPFPVLVDADRSVYRAYGLGRGTRRRVWSPRALRRYAEILRRDGLGVLGRATEDVLQLGGDFVIDRRGRLAWAYWGAGPDDRPPVERLVEAVRSC